MQWFMIQWQNMKGWKRAVAVCLALVIGFLEMVAPRIFPEIQSVTEATVKWLWGIFALLGVLGLADMPKPTKTQNGRDESASKESGE
jgi:hypothetical protein